MSTWRIDQGDVRETLANLPAVFWQIEAERNTICIFIGLSIDCITAH